MPLGPANDKGTVLYYEETGVPAGATTYTTLILVHGAMFHGAIFRRMYPYAAANNLRIVCVNKRDYVGSTPYTIEELNALRGTTEEQRTILETIGLQLAYFIAWFIETERIPPISEAGGVTRTGGFALAGWSAGNIVTISCVGNAHKLPEATRELFASYFRTIVMHALAESSLLSFTTDMSVRTAGEVIDSGLRAVWRDPTVPPDEQAAAFEMAVSAYYPPLADIPADLSVITARKPLLEEGSSRPVTSVNQMRPEELSSMIDGDAFRRSQLLVVSVDHDILRQNTRRALFDCRVDAGDGKKVIWPELRVASIWCDQTLNDVLIWNWRIAQLWEAERELGHDGLRPLEILRFDNANHFPHWDDAERFTKFIANSI
ncbi:hypothetical protein CERSUDRAFT_92325 [Gelatoporia subvermispora B]|uniref:AB hydrolase-1 domain-containing protein n=1 Tax=Ceriporiopsis subvermispora (strain B) TaxID=914234 RepID=M2RMY6_CERS8|nr:hypothetical protein CERSUDRAFT_92325 [Gelatoporia subvermispora B]